MLGVREAKVKAAAETAEGWKYAFFGSLVIGICIWPAWALSPIFLVLWLINAGTVGVMRGVPLVWHRLNAVHEISNESKVFFFRAKNKKEARDSLPQRWVCVGVTEIHESYARALLDNGQLDDAERVLRGEGVKPKPESQSRKWRCEGVDHESRLETAIVVDATDQARARVMAELSGVTVTSIIELSNGPHRTVRRLTCPSCGFGYAVQRTQNGFRCSHCGNIW